MKYFLVFVLVMGILTSVIKGFTTEGEAQAMHHELENTTKKQEDVSSMEKTSTHSNKTESIILPATIAPVRKERAAEAAQTTPKAPTRKVREATAAPQATAPKAPPRKTREATTGPRTTTPKAPTRKVRQATAAPQATAPKAPPRKTREATNGPRMTTAKVPVKH